MLCTQCNTDVKRKDRPSGRCPRCGQPFVTEPTRDGITDRFLARSAEAVSGAGTFFYLESQLAYEIRRRALRRSVSRRGWAGFFFALALLTLWPAGGLLVLGGILGIVGIGLWFRAARFGTVAGAAATWARKWLEANPSPSLVTAQSPRPWNDAGAGNGESLGEASFDRVLVCQHEALVDLFLLNRFHFHYSCPVLGGERYPRSVFADMMARLKANPHLTVVILHDLTPAGRQFASEVQTHDVWFGDHEGATLVDAGLLTEQKKMLRRLLVPLSDIPGATAGGATVDGLPPGTGAEVTLLRPQLLMQLVAASLDSGQPFHRLPHPLADGSGYG